MTPLRFKPFIDVQYREGHPNTRKLCKTVLCVDRSSNAIFRTAWKRGWVWRSPALTVNLIKHGFTFTDVIGKAGGD